MVIKHRTATEYVDSKILRKEEIQRMFFDIQNCSEREQFMYEVYYLYKVVNLQSEQWQVESTSIINNKLTCQPVLWIRR